jgi:urea transport system permease protein
MRWLFALFVFLPFSTAFAQSELPPIPSTGVPVSTPDPLQSALQNLAGNTSFKNKADAIDTLVALNNERVLPVLKALVDGNLYFRKSDSTVVVGSARDADIVIYDALTGTSHGTAML